MRITTGGLSSRNANFSSSLRQLVSPSGEDAEVRHLLEHVVDEVVLGVRRLLAAAAAPVALGALEHAVERGAQLLHLRRRQRVLDLQPVESAELRGLGKPEVERTSRNPHCWKNATSAASASSTTGTG